MYVHLNIDIVPCDNSLSTDGTDLDLDIHNTKPFGADVNLNETGVYRFVELSEASHKTDRTYDSR
jgi:hypothetical protein